MELRTELITFKYLYKIIKIELDIVTFKKFSITRSKTLESKPGYELVNLDKEEGVETHKAKVEVIAEIAGQVGLLIKGFGVKITGKKIKKVVIDCIIYIEPKQVNQSIIHTPEYKSGDCKLE